ncbi:hypothetical protein M2T82_00810 [Elizabethkingia ursingii]|uniref:hypothetical protein n=1 Tax=Elizabethkingia ursingii TaxID=1756150 RepID=UPI0020120FAD|nr:hypothetical protein [Elizabethkingia ursingii]MCL1666594.1 hypothetical protein [Elizabethkingia ursingii]
MKKKIVYFTLFLLLIFIIYALFRPDAMIKALLTTKMQSEVPTEFQNKFAEKEKEYHISSLTHKGGYPESFYRSPNKYDFAVYAFDGISNSIQNIKFLNSDNSLEPIINQVNVPTEFMQGIIHYFRDNMHDKVKQIRFNGNILNQKLINGSYIFKTKGKYEIFFNDKRMFLIDTDTENYIIIKNEGKFYQICILEIYDKINEKEIVSKFETY